MLFHGAYLLVRLYCNKPQMKNQTLEVFQIYIYPNNLKAKPTLWLWALRDVAVIGVGFVLSIRLEDASILDFLRYAMCFLFLKQQYFEWRENET